MKKIDGSVSEEKTKKTIATLISLRDETHMTSMKIVKTPPPHLSNYVQNSFTP